MTADRAAGPEVVVRVDEVIWPRTVALNRSLVTSPTVVLDDDGALERIVSSAWDPGRNSVQPIESHLQFRAPHSTVLDTVALERPAQITRPGVPERAQFVPHHWSRCTGQQVDSVVGIAGRDGGQQQAKSPPPIDVVIPHRKCAGDSFRNGRKVAAGTHARIVRSGPFGSTGQRR